MNQATSKDSDESPLKRSAPRERNLTRTGLITLITLCMSALLVSRIPKLFGPERDLYVCTTSIAHGLNGLQPGSEVWFGGIPCGEVLEIKTAINPNTGFPTRLEAVFNLNRTISLRQDANLGISAGLTGGNAVLQINNRGQLTQPWTIDAPRFISLNETSRGTQKFLGLRASQVLSKSTQTISEFTQNARPFIDDVSLTTERIKSQLESVVHKFNESLPVWKTDVQNILSAQNDWQDRWSDIRSLITDIQNQLSPVTELMAWIRGDGAVHIERIQNALAIMRSNGTGIQQKFSDVEQYAQAVLAKGRAVINQSNDVVTKMQKALPNLQTDYKHIRARNSLAGAQLSLLFKDILGTAITAVTTVPNDASWDRRILFESIESVNLAIESLGQTQQILNQVISTHSTALEENPRILNLLTEAADRDSQVMNEKLQALYQLFLRRSTK